MGIAKQYKLGRYDECEIVLNHITVSRLHAEFFVDPQLNVFLTDLKSSYGTFVNSKRISEPVLLSKGDIVSFGDEQFFDWELYFLGTAPIKNPFDSEVKGKFDLKIFIFENKDIVLIYLAILIMFYVLNLQIN